MFNFVEANIVFCYQVWRAELVLADFVLHKMFTSSEFDGIVAVELGAGTGNLVAYLGVFASIMGLCGRFFLRSECSHLVVNSATNRDINAYMTGFRCIFTRLGWYATCKGC